VDVGGESTRPGAEPVSAEQELGRVMPVIDRLRDTLEVPISIDTSKGVVMREAVAAGAAMINDVRALREDGALEAAVELDVPVCLMHMAGEPRTMQRRPVYENVVDEVVDFFRRRSEECMSGGLKRENVIIDPGFGFGKTVEHNLQLLRNLREFVKLGFPVLVGMSRKSMLGELLDRPVEQRLYGGLALAVYARQQGANIVRTHDVAATVDALRVVEAVGGTE
jgi:dihydropteroate synthase